MNPKKAYQFCPKCAGKFIPQKGNLSQCSSCNYHFYINPILTNGVVLENESQEILLVKRKFPPKKDYWDVAGGFIKPEETIEQSIKREVKEELGIEIKIGKIIGIYSDKYCYEGVLNSTLCLIVSAKMKSGKIRPADDVASYKFFPKTIVLNQKIAFKGVKRGLTDYINSQTSLPNLTA